MTYRRVALGEMRHAGRRRRIATHRPNKFNFQHMAAALALANRFVTPAVAFAQAAVTAPTQGGARIIGGAAAPRGRGQSLADILEKVDWDPATRGTLLIVSPEETFHVEPEQPRTAEEFRISREEPEPETNGQYRLIRLGDFYDRRLVNLPSISVFAPATMAVLNTTHLPKPDAYAGMTAGEKAKLLESTFTPDQWRQVATTEGIGAGDLKKKQRDIFLSMLPEPFVVSTPNPPTIDDSGISRPTPPTRVTLSEDQRESVRISLARRLDWSFKSGPNSITTFSSSQSSDPNVAQKPRLQIPPTSFEANSDIFGVSLVENVPSRLKASQLPADWQALEKTIDLHEAATVGDLVKRIAKQTGAELYCDPRYEDRTLYIRGVSAQAADLCNALAWGLTGSWRRLGAAFVLTDDLVGLGTRHAVIDNWIRENTLLAQIRQEQTDDALASSHFGDYLHWAADDPLKPSDDLNAKIEGYEKQGPADVFGIPYVPTNELSPAAQEQIRRQVAQQEESRQRMAEQYPNMPAQEPIQSGSVYLAVNVQPSYEIPGVGSVTATDITFSQPRPFSGEIHFGRQSVSDAADAVRNADNVVPIPPPITFPMAIKERVLLVDGKAETDLVGLAQEAHARGFTQLWVSAKRGETDVVQAAVKAGLTNGLIVQAVVPLIRPASADKPELLDRNVLGETLTDYAKRWKSQLEELHVPEEDDPKKYRFYGGQEPIDAWRKATLVARMLRGGDFLRCDDAAAIKLICDDVAATAAAPGLGGVVFRDMAAPGFNAPIAANIGSGMSDGSPGTDPLLSMGYEESTRFACLRKNGFDPIDLSPLSGGQRIQLPPGTQRFGSMPEMSLPFFPDYGTSSRNGASPRSVTLNGQNVNTMGAKDAWERWCAFRQNLDSNFIAAVADAVRAKAPNVQTMVRRTSNPLSDDAYYFGSLDAPAAVVKPAETSQTPQAPAKPNRSRDTLHDSARSASRVAYASCRYDETYGADGAKNSYLNGLAYTLRNRVDWDGIVVDLSEASPARTLELLAAFPAKP